MFRTCGKKPVRFYNSTGLTILLTVQNKIDCKAGTLGLSVGTVMFIDSEILIQPGVEFVAIFKPKSESNGSKEEKDY